MTRSVDLAKSQELAVEAFVGSGSYRTQSDMLRSAVDELIRRTPKATRIDAAVWAYRNAKATLSQAAALADVPHEEMHRILVREGHFRGQSSAKEIEAETAFLTKHAKPRRVEGKN